MTLHGHKAERGDKIWSILYGRGTVAMADADCMEVVFYENSTRPISLVFEKDSRSLKMLFWKEQTLDNSKPLHNRLEETISKLYEESTPHRASGVAYKEDK